MASRVELQTKFEELLGSRNVYYDPPTSIVMKYDAIRYSLSTIKSNYADNKYYSKMICYDGIVISKKNDPDVVDLILDLPYCSPGKPYVSDNLHHYPFTFYW